MVFSDESCRILSIWHMVPCLFWRFSPVDSSEIGRPIFSSAVLELRAVLSATSDQNRPSWVG